MIHLCNKPRARDGSLVTGGYIYNMSIAHKEYSVQVYQHLITMIHCVRPLLEHRMYSEHKQRSEHQRDAGDEECSALEDEIRRENLPHHKVTSM